MGWAEAKETTEVKERKTGRSEKKGGRERGEPETAVNDSEATLSGVSNELQLLCTHAHAHTQTNKKSVHLQVPSVT